MMDRKAETRAVKQALKDAGIACRVRHGTGTAWGWLDIHMGEVPYSRELSHKVKQIAQDITGRRGTYDGNINVHWQ